MMTAHLYHDTLFRTIIVHYTPPLCLTISPMMHARLQHNILFGTIKSHTWHISPYHPKMPIQLYYYLLVAWISSTD